MVKNQTASNAAFSGLKIGDFFEDLLEPAKRGVKTCNRVNGRICFIENPSDDEPVGDRWRLRLVGENPSCTVYFARAEEIVEAKDGTVELLRRLSIPTFAYPAVRKAHRIVSQSESACVPGSLGLAGALMQVCLDTQLPATYREYLAKRVKGIYDELLPADDVRFLDVLKVLAYCAPEPEKPSAFQALMAMQDVVGDTDRARASAMANVGEALFKQARFGEALGFFRRANDLCGDYYVSAQLATCYAREGKFEEAYNLLAEFPPLYFSSEEWEWASGRQQVLFEK